MMSQQLMSVMTDDEQAKRFKTLSKPPAGFGFCFDICLVVTLPDTIQKIIWYLVWYRRNIQLAVTSLETDMINVCSAHWKIAGPTLMKICIGLTGGLF